MTLRSSDLQSDSDLDSIRNSCDVLEKEFVGLLAPWTSFSFEQGQLKTPFTKTRNKGHFLENMIPVCHGLPQLGRSHAEKHSLTSAPY